MEASLVKDLPEEDQRALRDALLADKKRGILAPLIPMDVDLDGDGIVDAWGLDDHNELVVVSGVNLDNTAYESDGDDAWDHTSEGED